jgi:peptide/nickel transport system substrate-binding protein
MFRYYSNEDELVTAAKLGEIDGFTTPELHEGLDNFSNYKFPLQGIYYALYFNLRIDKFKDIYLRQKLEKVLPIEKIITDRGIGVEGPISRSLFTSRQLVFYKYEEKFQDNLPTTEITLTIPDTESHYKFAKLLKSIWEDKLNIKVNITKIPASEMLTKVIEPRNFEILLYGQEVGRDPDRYVNWHSAQKEYPGLNLSGFEHVRADRALEEGRNELSNEVRVKHYNEFQRVINEQTPAIFLYHPYVNYYISKYIKGIGDKYTFIPYDRFLDFFNWKRIETN